MVDAAAEHCSGGASSGGASEVGVGSQVYDTTTPVFMVTSTVCVHAVETYWQLAAQHYGTNIIKRTHGIITATAQWRPEHIISNIINRSQDAKAISATQNADREDPTPTQMHDLATTAFGLGFPGKPGPHELT